MEHFIQTTIDRLELELDFAKFFKRIKIKKKINYLKEVLNDYDFYKKEVQYKWGH